MLPHCVCSHIKALILISYVYFRTILKIQAYSLALAGIAIDLKQRLCFLFIKIQVPGLMHNSCQKSSS